MFIHGTLSTIRQKVRDAKITRTALILLGPAMAAHDFEDSRLYDADFSHILRVGSKGAIDEEEAYTKGRR